MNIMKRTKLEKTDQLCQLIYKRLFFCHVCQGPNLPYLHQGSFVSITFAPLGGATPDSHNYAILWHEAIAGRLGSEISSAFVIFLKTIEAPVHVVLWCDNCSVQNKNWYLFIALFQAVQTMKFKSVTLKYLITGHTFMSGNSVHAQIEKRMKRTKSVFCFNNFVDCVDQSGMNTTPVTMSVSDFVQYTKRPKSTNYSGHPIADMAVVCFIKNDNHLHYKLRHSDLSFIATNFIKRKWKPTNKFPIQSTARGENSSKK